MKKNIRPILLILLILLTVWFVYQPALSGGFIFDDFNNLRLLAVLEGDLSLHNIKEYLASQKSGPVGRPLSSLSFLLDANNWPVASERPFKTTNLILHLVNTALLFLFLLKLFALYDSTRKERYWMAFVACALWALHPFFVSTTMYVIQRMAMLPATFTLIGLLLYLKGRVMLDHKPLLSLILMVFAVFGCTLLAILSKENGVLLLPLIAVFEFVVLQKLLQTELNKTYKYGLFVLPIIVLIAALIYKLPDHTIYYDMRTYDMYERVLTQSRMLFKYMYYLWVPDYLTEGVFNDGIMASKGLLQPITTILSVIGIVGFLILSWFLREKSPLISFAVLFYLVGHLLESTYLPLELYYEHRNYLPAMLLFIPVSLLFLKLKQQPKLYYTIPSLLIIFLVFLTFLRANVWGNNFLLHYETAQKFPESARATNSTASLLAWEGEFEKALEMLEYGINNHEKLQLRMNKISLLCELKRVSRADMDHLLNEIKRTDFVKDDMLAYRDMLHNLHRKDCYQNFGDEYAQKYLNEFRNKDLFKTSETARKFFFFQNATVQANLSNFDESLESFKNIIEELDGLKSDPVFESTAILAVDFLKQLDFQSAVDLADYYANYCEQNFSDCDIDFINQLREKVNNESPGLHHNSSEE